MEKENESTKELVVGKDYIDKDGLIVIDRLGGFKNRGFINRGFDGNNFEHDLFCSRPNEWREATEEEVVKAFEKHLIHRYGEDWKTMKIKERHPSLPSSIVINDGLWFVCISNHEKGWNVWNENSLLYCDGIWVERLEEPKIHIKEAIKEKIAIHCATEKEAERILGMAHELGHKWCMGGSFKDYNYWDTHEDETCYYLSSGSYCYYDYCEKHDYTIIPSTQIADLMVEKKTVCTPAPEKNLDSFPDIDLVLELRKRGYEVTAERTITIKL